MRRPIPDQHNRAPRNNRDLQRVAARGANIARCLPARHSCIACSRHSSLTPQAAPLFTYSPYWNCCRSVANEAVQRGAAIDRKDVSIFSL